MITIVTVCTLCHLHCSVCTLVSATVVYSLTQATGLMCAKVVAQAAILIHVCKGWLSDAIGQTLINSFDSQASHAQLTLT